MTNDFLYPFKDDMHDLSQYVYSTTHNINNNTAHLCDVDMHNHKNVVTQPGDGSRQVRGPERRRSGPTKPKCNIINMTLVGLDS